MASFSKQKLPASTQGRRLITFRSIWRLRYRAYALIVTVVLLPVLYGNNSYILPEIQAVGFETVQTSLFYDLIRKQTPTSQPTTPTNSGQNQPVQIITKNGQKILVDKAGQMITDDLKAAGYDLGFISSEAFVDLNLPLPVTPKKEEVVIDEKPKTKTLDDVLPRPANPQRRNLLRYPAYNITAPVIYTSLEDLFNKKPNCDPARDATNCLNFSSPIDNSPVNSPLQRKLQDGVVHMAFTPQPGELGNSYIVGHSSNYSFVRSAYNSIFKPLERRSKVGEEFFIYDRFGRELKFRVFEVKEIMETDTLEAYKNYPDKRVVTLQTSILVNGKPLKRWLTRGELVV